MASIQTWSPYIQNNKHNHSDLKFNFPKTKELLALARSTWKNKWPNKTNQISNKRSKCKANSLTKCSSSTVNFKMVISSQFKINKRKCYSSNSRSKYRCSSCKKLKISIRHRNKRWRKRISFRSNRNLRVTRWAAPNRIFHTNSSRRVSRANRFNSQRLETHSIRKVERSTRKSQTKETPICLPIHPRCWRTITRPQKKISLSKSQRVARPILRQPQRMAKSYCSCLSQELRCSSTIWKGMGSLNMKRARYWIIGSATIWDSEPRRSRAPNNTSITTAMMMKEVITQSSCRTT